MHQSHQGNALQTGGKPPIVQKILPWATVIMSFAALVGLSLTLINYFQRPSRAAGGTSCHCDPRRVYPRPR